MDDLAEPVVRGASRALLWLIRVLLEALFEYVIEAASELSRRRSWSGWIPALLPAVLGALLAGLAWADGRFWTGAICLAVCSLPAAGRAIYVIIVPAVPRRS